MTTLQVQTRLTFEDLLHSLQQLNADELNVVAHKTAVIKAQKKSKGLPQAEVHLLHKINNGVVPQSLQVKCAKLTEKMNKHPLSETERKELTTLVDKIELFNAKRLSYLWELAQLRQISLDELMNTLEIQPLSYGLP